MFACEQCGKDYASQYALNRHMQNHGRDSQHTCNICHVTYSRRDLLARHKNIHKRSRSETTAAVAVDPLLASTSPPSTRRRRHTACVRCAQQRKKCTGGEPCNACTLSDHQCSFPVTRGRISRARDGRQNTAVNSTNDADVQPTTQSPDTSMILESGLEHETETAEGASYLTTPHPRISFDPEQPLQAQELDPMPVNTLSLYDMDQPPESFALDLNDLDSWAWLHENLYLRPDLSSLPNANNGIGPILPIAAPQTHATSHESHPFQPSSMTSVNSSTNVPTFQSDEPLQDRQHIVHKIVSYAAMINLPISPKSDHGEYWLSVSGEIQDAFHITLGASQHVLLGFIDLYLQHFWPLWPLLAKHNLSFNQLHPLLYLVLASIGAMYGDDGSLQFGRSLHNRICIYLTVAFEPDDVDGDFTWLAQARLYTQVAALYFGQPKAFTYAQHLGALLVAQARRVELFSADQCERAHHNFMSLRNAGQNRRRLEIWLQLEARRRLAFGIFRVDTYTSILMDTRPLLSLDEIDMSFPYCDDVWRATEMPIDACLYMIDHDRTPSRHLRASDIYRIALDPNEILPALDPIAHELLLFGLQRRLGRFAYDTSALERMTGTRTPLPDTRPEANVASLVSKETRSLPTPRESNQLTTTYRRMHLLKQEFESMLLAQRKWEEALPSVKTFVVQSFDRSSLMSGLVLFHLGFLRLHAPVSKLHRLQYRLTKDWHIDPSLLAAISNWTATPDARLAAQRSCDLVSLVASEAFDTEVDHVQFNLLAFIALHHAVVVLWCYATACDGGVESDNDIFRKDTSPSIPSIAIESTVTLYFRHNHIDKYLEVRRQNTEAIINASVDLFNRVSPGNWSSFAEAAAPLARLGFPGG